MTRPGFTLFQAFKCAAHGVRIASRERNFRIELVFLVACVALGLFFDISALEWAICVSCFGLVLGAETINTAIESVVDLVSPEYHELAGAAKDCAAGATYILALSSLLVGIILFLPRILALIGISL